MSATADRPSIQAQVADIDHLLVQVADHPIMEPNLRARRADLEQELAQWPAQQWLVPRVQMFFYGQPVMGTLGIDAAFVSKILDPFQQMVKTEFVSRRHGGTGTRGKRRGESHARLLLTGLPRGSVGVELSQPAPEDMLDAQDLSETLQALTEVIRAAGMTDDSFDNALATSNTRILTNLRQFFGQLADNHARIRMESGSSICELDDRQVAEGRARVEATRTEDRTVTLPGTFRGLTLDTWRFDFRPAQGDPISGELAESIEENEAAAMAQRTNQPVEAVLKLTTLTSRSGAQRLSYELLRLQ
jgi:hypothetical protein